MEYINKIYNHSSTDMKELPDNSIDLMVTSPPYNIDIQYGNKWKDRQIINSKGIKYEDKLEEDHDENERGERPVQNLERAEAREFGRLLQDNVGIEAIVNRVLMLLKIKKNF